MSDIGEGNLKTYLGDGAYAECDGFGLIVTTEDGVRTTNRVVLEPEHVLALVRFAERRGVLAAKKEQP